MQDNNSTPPADTPVTPEPTLPVAEPVAPVSTPLPEPTPVAASFEAQPAVAPIVPPVPGAPVAAVPGAKNHLVAILLSIFVGGFGVDRFYLGHIGLGVAKLLLSWATLGIWWLVDVILIATRKVKNVTWED